MVDLGLSGLGVGDEVTVISREPTAPNSVQGLAKNYGLFQYSVLTSLSNSVKRIIVA